MDTIISFLEKLVHYSAELGIVLAELAGTYSTSNFIFLFVIFLLIVKLFHMTIKQSQMETRLRELVQKMAIDEKEERDRAKEKED